MKLKEERENIREYCLKMLRSGLTKGTGGNISIYNRQEGLVAISPSGMPYEDLTAEDIAVVNIDGEMIEGKNKPSSEISMHLGVYKNREELNAVVHTHSIFAKTLSSLRIELPAVSYLVAVAGKNVNCAEYASFGTPELATNALKGLGNNKAVLLANHGLLAVGVNIQDAFNVAEEIEMCCEVYVRSLSIGTPVILDNAEMDHMLERFKTYGLPQAK